MPYSAVDAHRRPSSTVGSSSSAAAGGDESSCSGVEVASCYESDGAGAAPAGPAIDADHRMFRQELRLPEPAPGLTASFVPTKLDAGLHMAYFEDERALPHPDLRGHGPCR